MHSRDVLVKKLVRLALASEYTRQPVRRSDINAKVFGELHGSGGGGRQQFRMVFEGAQEALREWFGMELVELPARERVTVRERRGMYHIHHHHHHLLLLL